MIIQPQIPPYKTLHHMNQVMNSLQNNMKVRQRFHACHICEGRHAFDTYWVELRIKCFNHNYNHPIDHC